MDHDVRDRRVLLSARGALGAALVVAAACSPARGEPVGVSHGGNDAPWARDAGEPAPRAPLAILPPDFRAKLRRVTELPKSEHLGGAPAVLWADEAGAASFASGAAAPEKALFVEELAGPATADGGTTPIALYVLAIDAGGARFGAADPKGVATLDDEGKGGSACARCHAESLRAPVWLGR
jgi:hypothetical protein